MASSDLRDELSCSVCLNIYKDPVTLTCGHSFCRICIENVLNAQGRSGVYTCPECRADFAERPALEKNRKLSNIAETFRCAHPESGDVGILCTYCDSPVPAAKTCLTCETSLCEKHLKKHHKSTEHVLTEPTASLENRRCPIHKKVLEYYCLEDATCVCVSCCLVGEHRGHRMDSLYEASEKKKAEMQNVLGRLMSKKRKTEKEFQRRQDESRDVQRVTADLTEETTALFMGIRERLETLEKKVQRQIEKCGDKFSNMISRLIEQLAMKDEEMSRKMSHIEELCNTTDPLTVLQGRGSDGEDFREAVEKSDDDANDFDNNEKPVEGGDNEEGSEDDEEEDGEDVEDDDESRDEKIFAVGEFGLIFATLKKGLDAVVSWAKRQCKVEETSDKFLDVNMTSNILLDVSTTSNDTAISGDGKTMTFPKFLQGRPEAPERFRIPQVLSTSGFFSGQHYQEVEGSSSGGWRIGMAYESIDREGDQATIGNNNKSWAVEANTNNQYLAIHDNHSTLLPAAPSCHRLGIFLDYELGRLSFYELCDPIQHLHTFKASFTEPLHIAILAKRCCWVTIRS